MRLARSRARILVLVAGLLGLGAWGLVASGILAGGDPGADPGLGGTGAPRAADGWGGSGAAELAGGGTGPAAGSGADRSVVEGEAPLPVTTGPGARAWLDVRVLDVLGRPVQSATVKPLRLDRPTSPDLGPGHPLREPPGERTDGEGLARLELDPGSYLVQTMPQTLPKDAFAVESEVELTAGAHETLELRLRGCDGSLRVRAEDRDGHPMAGVPILARWRHGFASSDTMRTDEHGRATLVRLPSEDEFEASVLCLPHTGLQCLEPERTITLTPGELHPEVVFVVDPRPVLTLTLHPLAGEPWPKGGRVGIVLVPSPGSAAHVAHQSVDHVELGPDQALRVEGLASGDYRLGFRLPDGARGVIPPADLHLEPGDDAHHAVVVEAVGRALRGVVRMPDGTPAKGARLRFAPLEDEGDGPSANLAASRQVISGEDGRYEVDLLPGLDHELWVDVSNVRLAGQRTDGRIAPFGTAAQPRQPVPAGTTDLDVTLHWSHRIVGRVLGDYVGSTVLLDNYWTDQTAAFAVDAEGRFTIPILRPGTYRIWVHDRRVAHPELTLELEPTTAPPPDREVTLSVGG